MEPNIWFTSDTHFSHSNIIKYCDRPFKHVDEMDEALIANWNAKVKPGDLVYHTGDFGMAKDIKRLENVLRRLNGQKYLVKGNHDYPKFLQMAEKYFVKMDKIMTLKIKDDDAVHGRQLIVLCHYPMLVWDKCHYGAWHLHGHCHGSLKPDLSAMRLDIGVDCHNYAPLSYDEVKFAMFKRHFKPVDHHDGSEGT